MTADRAYTTDDVLRCFPWLSHSVLHDRIKKGFLPIWRRSRIRGTPNTFGMPEVVQAGVVDILAQLGLLINAKNPGNLEADVRGERLRQLFPKLGDAEFSMDSAFDLTVLRPFYSAYDFHVTVIVNVDYKRVPASRRYYVSYVGQDDVDPAIAAITEWRKRTSYGENWGLAFVDVRRIWEECDLALMGR